jgi:cysteine-rich repeat protein
MQRSFALLACLLSACSFIDDFGSFRIASDGDGGPEGKGDGATNDGGVLVSCQGAADGTACGSGSGLLCIGEVCRVSSCGDGYVDPGRDEQCDDQNTVPGDGCEPMRCVYSCSEAADCDNDFVCDGSESCVDHRCQKGEPTDDVDCERVDGEAGTCGGGYCVPPGCGNGTKDPGEECDAEPSCRPDCLKGCERDSDCPDDNLCDDIALCDTLSGECNKQPAPVCDDQDACTRDRCEPARGCVYALDDGDRDGFAAGKCKPGSTAKGGDCDDERAVVYPGAQEYCDGLDNDCDEAVDDQAVKATCYPDADGDGFPLEQNPLEACICPDGTMPERADHAWDCWDELDDVGRDVFPGQTEFFASGYDARCRAGSSPCEVVQSFDFNCDRSETRLLTTGNVTSCGALGGALSCTPSGFVGTPPECGKSGAFTICQPNGGLLGGCSANTMQRAQLCQ